LQKILFYGELGVGKTTLTHALATYANKQEVSTLEFNVDATAHALKQTPFFDVRKTILGKKASEEKNFYRSAEKVLNKQLLEEKLFRNALKHAETEKVKLALFDSNAPPSFFLSTSMLSFARDFFDALVLVIDASSTSGENLELAKAFGGLTSLATRMPLIIAFNKIDLIERKKEEKQKKLLDENEKKQLKTKTSLFRELSEKIIFTRTSGWERIGLNELLEALKKIKEKN